MFMNKNIINKVFGHDVYVDLFDCELFLLEKIMDNCNGIEYLFDCRKKIAECIEEDEESSRELEKYNNIIAKYINNVFEGKIMNEHKKVCGSLLARYKFDSLDMLVTESNILNIYHMCYNKKINNSDIHTKLHNIKNIYSSEFASNLFTTKYSCGRDYEECSMFSWLADENIAFNINEFGCVYDTMNELYKKYNRQFLDELKNIIDMNKNYSYFDIYETNKSSSFKFICILSKILLNLAIDNVHINDRIHEDNFIKTELEYNDETEIEDILVCVTLKYLYTYYNVMDYIDTNGYRKTLKDTIRSLDIMNDLDSDYYDMTKIFLSLAINKGMYLGQELFFVVRLNMERILENESFDESDKDISTHIKYIIDIIGGLSTNPHIRQRAVITISKILYGTKLHNFSVPLINNLLFHICKTDVTEIYTDNNGDGISNIIKNFDYSTIGINDIKDRISLVKALYRMISMSIAYIDELRDTESEDDESRCVFSASLLIDSVNIIYKNMFSSIQMPRELMLSIMNLTNTLLKTYREYGNIDDVFVTTIQNVLSVFIENDFYCSELTKFVDIDAGEISDIMDGHDDEDKIIRIIKKIISEKKVDKDSQIPDKFLDPLLMTKIVDPVAIPNVDLIFDRASILCQLYDKEINPYTRETLTVQQFEQYNTLSHIIEKLKDFKTEYNDWSEMYEI